MHIRHASGRIHKDLKAENVMVDLPAAESPILALHSCTHICVHLNFICLKGASYSPTHLKQLHTQTSFLELRKGRANRKERLVDGGDVQSPASVKLIDFDTVPWQH